MARPLPGNIEERCRAALAHIVKGLVSLRLARNFEGEEQQDTYAASGSNVTQKSPDTSPISSTSSDSLHDTETKASLSENSYKASREDSSMNKSNEKFQEVRDGDDIFSKAVVPRRKGETKFYHKDLAFLSVLVPVKWEGTSAALLLRKASSVYHSLAFASVSKGKYGRSLRYCKMALRCFGSYKSLTVDCEGAKDSLLSSILCSCGDAYLMLAKCKENLAVHQEDYKFKSKDDTFIAEFARQHRGELYEVCSLRIEFVLELEGNLSKSASLYEAAIDVTPEDTNVDKLMSLTRRVGNVRNELGVYYMNCAVCTMDSGNCPSAQEQDLLKKSYTCFEKGIQAFQAIEDEPNVALLLSNTGRLMRMCAQAVGGTSRGVNKKERGEFSAEERVYFNRAIESYQKALRCLSERKCCPEVWDTVTWELSGAYYTMATLLQDFAPLAKHSQEEVEKEVTQLMMKALKLCEHIGADHSQILQGSGNCKNLPGTQYLEQLEHRLGSIHHRLASLYHNSYRNQVGDQTKKKAKTLAELHYLKTSTYFKPEKYPCQAIRIQLERVAMCEYYISIHGGFTATIKTLQQALDFILSTEKALKTLAEGRIEDQRQSINSGSTEFESEELKSLLPILENRLYGVLKELVKVHSQRKGKTKLPADLIIGMEKAKHLYSVALRASSNKKTDLELPGKCEHLAQILHALRETRDDNNKT